MALEKVFPPNSSGDKEPINETQLSADGAKLINDLKSIVEESIESTGINPSAEVREVNHAERAIANAVPDVIAAITKGSELTPDELSKLSRSKQDLFNALQTARKKPGFEKKTSSSSEDVWTGSGIEDRVTRRGL